MKALITQEMMDRLLEAAERAEAPGACRYVRDGEPCCVIAQLGALEGATVEQMANAAGEVEPYEDEDGDTDHGIGSSLADVFLEDFGLSKAWPQAPLVAVQKQWDAAKGVDIEEARYRLVARIQVEFAVQD